MSMPIFTFTGQSISRVKAPCLAAANAFARPAVSSDVPVQDTQFLTDFVAAVLVEVDEAGGVVVAGGVLATVVVPDPDFVPDDAVDEVPVDEVVVVVDFVVPVVLVADDVVVVVADALADTAPPAVDVVTPLVVVVDGVVLVVGEAATVTAAGEDVPALFAVALSAVSDVVES